MPAANRAGQLTDPRGNLGRLHTARARARDRDALLTILTMGGRGATVAGLGDETGLADVSGLADGTGLAALAGPAGMADWPGWPGGTGWAGRISRG